MIFFNLKKNNEIFCMRSEQVPVQLECEKDELKTVNGAEELQLEGPVVSHAPHANGN